MNPLRKLHFVDKNLVVNGYMTWASILKQRPI